MPRHCVLGEIKLFEKKQFSFCEFILILCLDF